MQETLCKLQAARNAVCPRITQEMRCAGLSPPAVAGCMHTRTKADTDILGAVVAFSRLLRCMLARSLVLWSRLRKEPLASDYYTLSNPEHLQVPLGARSHLQLAAEGPAVGVQAAAAAAAVGQAGSAEAFGRPAGR